MHRRPLLTAKLLLTIVLAAAFLLPSLTGCEYLAALLEGVLPGDEVPGGQAQDAPQAVMTAIVDDDLVDLGLNPDLRPPLMYQFDSLGSLDRDGESIHHSSYGRHLLAWDYGDGQTRGFEWSDYAPRHIYREEGTYLASLTVRSPSGEAEDTTQMTITIGPAWLEIVSLRTWDRQDGQVGVEVIVRNQSDQALRLVSAELLVDGSIWPANLGVTFLPESDPSSLVPNATYTFTTAVGPYTGTLTARSSFCTPVAP